MLELHPKQCQAKHKTELHAVLDVGSQGYAGQQTSQEGALGCEWRSDSELCTNSAGCGCTLQISSSIPPQEWEGTENKGEKNSGNFGVLPLVAWICEVKCSLTPSAAQQHAWHLPCFSPSFYSFLPKLPWMMVLLDVAEYWRAVSFMSGEALRVLFYTFKRKHSSLLFVPLKLAAFNCFLYLLSSL